jgi:hypothetical protein
VKSTSISKLWLKHELYGDGRTAWLVVRDLHAGSKHVYTVYRIELTGTKEAQVIGRELPLGLARKIVKQSMENL